jgi:hypothetical protein
VTRGAAHFFPRLNQAAAEPLVVSPCMKMSQETDSGQLQGSLPEEDHALQALVLNFTPKKTSGNDGFRTFGRKQRAKRPGLRKARIIDIFNCLNSSSGKLRYDCLRSLG